MTVLDTLEVVIEADRTGLESQLRRASQSIQQFVSSMNSQQVSWTQILTKSITPALMASIASSFAMAVTQALKFQNALQAASLNTSDSFKVNSGGITDSVLEISKSTGQSASDVATAMGILGNSYKDAGTQLAILNDISKVATIRNLALAEAVEYLNPVLQNWGIDTVPEANRTISALSYATSLGKIQFDDLTKSISEAGFALRGSISASDAAIQLEKLSTVSGQTSQMVISQFDVISKGLVDTYSNLNVLNGGFDHMQNLLKTGGLPAVFQQISDTLRQAGPAAAELGKNMGFTAEQVRVLVESGKGGAFGSVKQSADEAALSVKDLNLQFQESLTFTKLLGIAWNSAMTDLLSLLRDVNKDMGKFLGDLLSAKSGWDTLNALGGNLEYQTTPSTLGISAPPQSNGIPTIDQAIRNMGSSPVTNNYSISQNFNISSVAGGETQLADSIMRSTYDNFKGR